MGCMCNATFQGNFQCGVGIFLMDSVGDSRDVFSAVRFSGDVEVSRLILRKHGVELLEGLVQIAAHLNLIARVAVAGAGKAEPGAHGVVNVEHVGELGPAVWADGEFHGFVDAERAVLDEQTKH